MERRAAARDRFTNVRFTLWVSAGFALLAVAVWLLTSGGNQPPGSLGLVGDIPNRVVSGPDQDIPCTENAERVQMCATPLPKLTAVDKASASALVVDDATIRLDHLGKYRVLLGQAVLARGMVQRLVLELGHVRSNTYRAPSFMLELEDALTHRTQPRNIDDKGLTDGPQRVDVYLTFDLQWYADGASIQVTRAEIG